MLIIKYRSHGLRLGHACFLSEEEIKKEEYKHQHCDLVYIYGVNTKIDKGHFLRTQHTLIKDLTPDEDSIFNSFGKSLRRHIRRSLKNQKVRIIFYTSQELTKSPEILIICKELFERMYASKEKRVVFNEKMAKALVKTGYLVVSMAYYKEKPIGFCAVLLDGLYARRWISAFDFRNNPDDSQVYGAAHKRLDWEVMVWCKSKGVTQIDLGGVNSFDEPNGIASFKLEFEKNNKITYDNYVVPTSIAGKVALWFMRKKTGDDRK